MRVSALARNHGWRLDYARGAIEEYRRFCFLAIVSDSPMTPSEEVDEVWHQHLTFSRDYWDRWCREALGRPLHHQPTSGGPAEATRFAEQYARTLARYEAYFGPPDKTFWPSTARRFGFRPRFKTVDLETAVVVPLPAVLGRAVRRMGFVFGLVGLMLAGAATSASARTADVLDWDGRSFLQLYLAAAAIALGVALVSDVILRTRAAGNAPSRELTTVELALLSGGVTRAADVIALQLIDAGHLAVMPDRSLFVGAARRSDSSPQLSLLVDHGPYVSRSSLVRLMQSSIAPAWDRLAREGLALAHAHVRWKSIITVSLVAPVTTLGLLKIVIGLSRERPVGFLVVLVVVTVILAGLIARAGRLCTASGRDALLRLEKRNARALRAPLPEEAIMAFAVLGASALAGTAMQSYAGVIKGIGNGDGGSGCGGGGGGCGGCGGN